MMPCCLVAQIPMVCVATAPGRHFQSVIDFVLIELCLPDIVQSFGHTSCGVFGCFVIMQTPGAVSRHIRRPLVATDLPANTANNAGSAAESANTRQPDDKAIRRLSDANAY
jgi:hypothetical protein